MKQKDGSGGSAERKHAEGGESWEGRGDCRGRARGTRRQGESKSGGGGGGTPGAAVGGRTWLPPSLMQTHAAFMYVLASMCSGSGLMSTSKRSCSQGRQPFLVNFDFHTSHSPFFCLRDGGT